MAKITAKNTRKLGVLGNLPGVTENPGETLQPWDILPFCLVPEV